MCMCSIVQHLFLNNESEYKTNIAFGARRCPNSLADVSLKFLPKIFKIIRRNTGTFETIITEYILNFEHKYSIQNNGVGSSLKLYSNTIQSQPPKFTRNFYQ